MPPLERNLDALRPWTPAAAALISRTEISADFASVIGIDGSATYRRVLEAPRRMEWLGGTAMPRSSAKALIDSLDVRTGNGLGLSIGTGFEWAALAQKLSRAQALYVYEPDPARARMALTLCDLSDILSTGKLVLLCGPPAAASDELSAFLSHNLGFDPPAVLHPLPTIPREERNAILGAGEAMVRRVVLERQSQINTLAQRLEGMEAVTDATVAFVMTPRYMGERLLLRTHADATETLFIDHHASAGIALRLRVLATHRPAKIVSDYFRSQIGCVPPAIAVETWIPPLVGAGLWDRVPAASAIAACDRIVVHGGSQADRLMERGIPQSQIEIHPLSRNFLVGLPSAPRVPVTLALRSRVAMIADLPPTQPGDFGMELPTHLAIFAAACDIIREEYMVIHGNAAPDVLRRAIARAGVAPDSAHGLEDPALGEPMLRVIRDVLIPTLPQVALAHHLIAQHVPLLLIGDWPGVDIPRGAPVTVEPFTRGTEGDGKAGANRWDEVAVLAHLSPSGMVSPLIWEVVGAGVAIVAPEHPADQQAGSIATLLKRGEQYASPSPQQCMATIKFLLRDSARRVQIASAASRDALAK